MKKRTACILLGIVISSVWLAGCGTNEATEAANESAETEREGNGEDEETEEAVKEAETEEAAGDEKAEEADEAEQEEESAQGEEEGTEAAESPAEDAPLVGILLPDEELKESAMDGTELQQILTEDGYRTELLYAGNDVSKQVSQIQEMLDSQVSALIIDPVELYAFPDVLESVKEQGIPVFAYDELIMDTDAVSYYTTFDYREIGQMIGNEIVDRKKLEDAQKEKLSYNIEFFMGSPDESRELFLYNGIMEVLQPYLDDGTLVCRSGRTSFDETGILRFSETRVMDNLTEILEEFYQDEEQIDIICTGFDGAARKTQEALLEAGYLPGSEGWPLINGVGCEAEAVKDIAEGGITFSVFMDRRVLAKECANLVDTYLKGETPEVNDYEQYDNGVKIIGTYTCDTKIIDRDNYELLIDNGYYLEEEVQPEALPSGTPVPAGGAEEEDADSDRTDERITPTPGEEETEEEPTPADDDTEVTPTPAGKDTKATPTPEEKNVTL
ncbi:MAG: sugar ABC transporter substrate-binding protein [Eubacteriales bacterium]|nr:sugar ABC transporter substrate-binding protein [Eubacteriales bacterium]